MRWLREHELDSPVQARNEGFLKPIDLQPSAVKADQMAGLFCPLGPWFACSSYETGSPEVFTAYGKNIQPSVKPRETRNG